MLSRPSNLKHEHLTKLMEKAVAAHNALPPIEKAIANLNQRRSFVRGNLGLDNPGVDYDKIIGRQDEYVILEAYLEARERIKVLEKQVAEFFEPHKGTSV